MEEERGGAKRGVRETSGPRIPLKYIRFWDRRPGSPRLLMEFLSTVIRVAKNLSNGSRDKLETHQASVGRGMFEVTLYSFTKERGNLGDLW